VPKIDAPSVAEHRAQVQQRLVDAAEKLLLESPDSPLTAGSVSSAAGIARNSIYRYVDTVDDLRALVVDRYLPGWVAAVHDGLAQTPPDEQVAAWVRVNLEQSSTVGHQWLASAGGTSTPSPTVEAVAARAHDGVLAPLVDAWRGLLDDADEVRMAVALTTRLLDAGFRQLGARLPGDVVGRCTGAAARAPTQSLPRA